MGNTQGLDESHRKLKFPFIPDPLTLLVSAKEIRKLYKRFSKLDTDKSGELEPEEFFDVPGGENFIKGSFIYREMIRIGSKSFGQKSYCRS